MRKYEGIEVKLHSFYISVLGGGEKSALLFGRLKKPDGYRANLDAMRQENRENDITSNFAICTVP